MQSWNGGLLPQVAGLQLGGPGGALGADGQEEKTGDAPSG